MLKPGSQFGLLTVIKEVDRHTDDKNRRYLVRCRCGSTIDRREDSIKKAYSCGCKSRSKKHGLSKHPLYRVWENMKKRCLNPSRKNYRHYGGRGITICLEWQTNPEVFIKWALRKGWRPGLELDRRNNDGNYEPKNCRFITHAAQMSNRRVFKNNRS